MNYWITHYFGSERYKKINGKPVIFVFAHDRLSADAKKFGASPKELLERARLAAVKAGCKGIYFIGPASADKKLLDFADLDSTYDALSAYNYHLGSSEKKSSRKLSISYPDLAAGYAQSWKWIIKNSNIPYILPLTNMLQTRIPNLLHADAHHAIPRAKRRPRARRSKSGRPG